MHPMPRSPSPTGRPLAALRLARSLLVLALLSPALARAEIVTLVYTATVKTVAFTPFGLAVPLGSRVVGCFRYDTAATDTNPNADRGDYKLAPGSGFDAFFLGHHIIGSGSAFLQVENLASDTFRFNDGDEILARSGVMSFDGSADPARKRKLTLAITGPATAFPNDSLAAEFPFPMNGALADPPHTFSLSDVGGTMLLQFTSLRQTELAPPSVWFFEPRPASDLVSLSWLTVPGSDYEVESSPDLLVWTRIGTGITAPGWCHFMADDLAARFPGGTPPRLFYRVTPGP